MSAATTFGALWVGDRFIAFSYLWTRLDHRTARQHRPESIALGVNGAGYMLDTVCTFTPGEAVEFVPPGASVSDLLAGAQQ